jgi:tetratricopeptide (TPR) repeat protein
VGAETLTLEWRTETDNWRLIAALLDQELRAPSPDPSALRVLCESALHFVKKKGDDARQRIQAAVAHRPEDADLRVCLAKAYLRVLDYTAAAAQIIESLRLSPTNREARLIRFTLLQHTEQWQARDSMVEEIARLEPMNSIVAFTRLMGGASLEQAQTQLAACDAALARDPIMTDATFFKAIALYRLGRRDEAAAVMNLDRFIDVTELPPDDTQDEADFRAGLAEELSRNPSLTTKHDRPLRAGLYAPDLQQADARHQSRLGTRLMAAVEAFIRRHVDAPEPFMTHRPKSAALAIWAGLYGRSGEITPHRHTSGWLSGVYYVAAPRAADADVYQGPLVLGALDPRYGITEPPWGLRRIEPVPGRLVLFPSYVSHGAEPTAADGVRISVAFDVVPCG